MDTPLERASERLSYHEDDVRDPPFVSEDFAAARCHLGVVGQQTTPYVDDGINIWTHGEVFNLKAACKRASLAATTFPAALALSHRAGHLSKFLAGVDGVFVALMYDSRQRRVHLITDRLGLKPVYVWSDAGKLAWTSELKALLDVPGFTTAFEPDAFEAMLRIGHMIGELTWFKNVRAAKAASVTSFCLKTGRQLASERYWSWSEIVPQRLSFSDAVEALRVLIVESVMCRLGGQSSIGLSLSGGLDSRAIIASARSWARERPTYTLGDETSGDIVYARRVAQACNTKHAEWFLSTRNWYQGRSQAVWKSDGMLNLRHTHYTPFHPQLKQLCRVNLNGFLGDALIGTVYLGSHPRDQRADDSVAETLYGDLRSYDNPADSFYDSPHVEPYVLNGRGRRMIGLGFVDVATEVESRAPMIDNRIIELVYSLPDSYRADKNLYHAALRTLDPALFRSIPWETTGRTIFDTLPVRDRLAAWSRKVRGGPQKLPALADYGAWLRDEPFLSAAKELLDPRKAVMREYVETDYSLHLKMHAEQKRNYAEHVCRAMTVEIWLRLVNNVPLPRLLSAELSN